MKGKFFNLLVTLSLILGTLSAPVLAGPDKPTQVPVQVSPEPWLPVTPAARVQPAAPAAPHAPQQMEIGEIIVGAPLEPFSFDGSLWDLAAEPVRAPAGSYPDVSPLEMPAPLERSGEGYARGETFDPNIQDWHSLASMPAPILTFDGVSNIDNVPEWGHMLVPPDSDGDVGPNHYIQTVNVVNQVYFKDGTPASPVFRMSNMWPPDDPCGQWDDGDPIGLYDPMADRWILTQFYIPGPYFECIAISKTPDPVNGGWWLYTVPTHEEDFWDYPKVGVWPDAYYMTANLFYGDPPAYVRVMALERSAMLAGQPARTVTVDVLDDFSLLPANLRGNAPPPGTPNYLLSAFNPLGALRLYEFAVDWDDPANSTLTSTELAVNPWEPAGGGFVPQLGTDILLQTLSDRLMQPLHYRRILSGTEYVESLWANHTISTTGKTSVRWYEIRDPGGTPTVHQQSTYAPDDTWRWMASMATDKDGNMAVGYSASSDSIYPGIRYAGRLFTDTLNVLAQDEVTMTVGGGFQDTWSSNPRTDGRWGDYTAMGVDPVDDCTFWYTNEYYPTTVITPNQSYNWQMSIGAFRFPSCAPLPAVGWLTGTVYNSVTSDLIGNVPLAGLNGPMTRAYAGSTDASGYFRLAMLPGTYTVTAGTLLGYPVPNSATGVVVNSGMTTTVDIGLDPYPRLVEAGITIVDAAPDGNANGYPEPNERNIELWEDLENVGVTTATNVSAQLFTLTPGVTVITDMASYPDIAAGDIQTNASAFVFTVDGGVPCGTSLDFMKVIATDQAVFTVTFSLDAIIPAVIDTHAYTSLDVPHVFTDSVSSLITITDDFVGYDVNVTVNITHPSTWDLRVPLFSPIWGSYLAYYNNVRGDANFFDTTFDDEALLPITGGRGPFSASFQPYWPLSLHEGASISGTWDLRVWDDVTTTVGTLNSWSMEVQELITPTYCAWLVPDLNTANVDYAEAGGNTDGNGWIDPGEDSIDLDVDLTNFGTLTATNVNAIVAPAVPSVTMNVDTSTYPDIGLLEVQANDTTYNFALGSDWPCGIPLDFEIEAATDDGTFNRTFSLPTGAAPVPVTVLVDDVESGAGGWTTGGDGAASWQITDEESHSPTHAWTEGVIPDTQYVNNADNWVQSPVYDFSTFASVTLSFWQIYDLEDDWDFGLVEVSRDGGTTWETVVRYSGYDHWTWTQAVVDLPLAFESNARIRFRFTSDTNTLGDGWHIDDIEISGGVRQCGMPTKEWDKDIWINDTLYAPAEGPFTVLPDDTVTVVDWVQVDSADPFTFTLTEDWTASLDFITYTVDGGTVTEGADYIEWTVTDGISGTVYAITKTFQVNGDNGFTDSIGEEFVLQGFLPEFQDLEFDIPALFSKDGPYSAEPDDVIPYTIIIETAEPIPLDGTLMMTDDLPVGVAYAGNLTFTHGSAWYISTTDTVYWNNAMGLNKAINSSAVTITFDVTVTAGRGDLVTNTADLAIADRLASAEHVLAVSFYEIYMPVMMKDF